MVSVVERYGGIFPNQSRNHKILERKHTWLKKPSEDPSLDKIVIAR